MLMTIKRKTSLWLIILESLFKNSFKIGLHYTHILNKGNAVSLKFPINTGYHKENFFKLSLWHIYPVPQQIKIRVLS